MKRISAITYGFIASFLCISVNLSAQTTTTPTLTNYNLKQMLPTSPEAAMLGKFGDIPIGYYTGTADISIPLYSVKEDGLEIPITLSYHSSGVKVEDQSTDVGLGWLLEPGGSIIEIVNGISDQTDNWASSGSADYAYLKSHLSAIGYHTSRFNNGEGCYPCSPNPTQGDSETEMSDLSQGYGQPDIYQYNFPGGYSGKFFIDPETHIIELMDKSKKVFFQQVNNTATWIATTLDGNKYYFSTQESSSDGSSFHTGRTWKLTKIITHNAKEIDFSYTSGTYSWYSYSESYHTEYPFGNMQTAYGDAPLMQPNEFFVLPSASITTYNVQTITQIKTPDVTLNFHLGSRQDMQTSLIQSIDIVSSVSNKKLKSYAFNYGYFAYSQVGGNYFGGGPGTDLTGKRLKLQSVQETGYDPVSGNGSNNPPYQFTYNESITLPLKTSFARDYWGYYNGANNTKLMPDLSYFYDDGQIIGFPFSTFSIVQGANRAPDSTQMAAGMLTQITYPTGGYTKFTYEPNHFSNYNYPDVGKLQNTLVNLNVEDENNVAITSMASFTIPRTLTFTVNSYFGRGYYTNPVTATQMQTAYVAVNKIESGTTTVVKEWQLNSTHLDSLFNATGGAAIVDTCQIIYDPNATYQLVASLPDALGDQDSPTKSASVTASMNYYNIPNTTANVSYGGGVRVSGVKNFDNTNKLISNKSIRYVDSLGNCSGILMSPLQFWYYRLMNIEWLYHYGPGGTNEGQLDANANIWFLSSESSVPFSTGAGGNIVGYSRVVETELLNNAATNGSHVYFYNNSPSETMYNTPDNPNLLNGMVSKEQVFNNFGKKLSETINVYSSLKDSTYMAYKNTFNMVSNFSCGPPNYFSIPANFPLYTIYTYPLNSHWYVIHEKITTNFDATSPLTDYNYYTYNAVGQMVQDSTINSKSQILLTKYIYPFDKYSTSTTALQLVDSAFYNNLLELHSYNNGIETAQAKLAYGIVNGQLVRDTLSKSFNGGAIFTDAIFNSYGPNKTLKQVKEKGIQPSSFLYDQNNSYLLAEASNAALRDIAYSSFELNQTGNWTIGSTSRDTSHAFSGRYSYLLSNGAISKSALTSSVYYIVSYWTMNSLPYTISGTQTGYPIKGPTINGWTYYEHLVTGVTGVSISGSGNIDEVRLYPKDAQMKTYTYTPLVGINTTVSEKNQVNYYEYDSFQRLMNIKDQYGNIVKHIDYHYQGQ